VGDGVVLVAETLLGMAGGWVSELFVVASVSALGSCGSEHFVALLDSVFEEEGGSLGVLLLDVVDISLAEVLLVFAFDFLHEWWPFELGFAEARLLCSRGNICELSVVTLD
jgi:hypothetical protein